jgi:hypothetical protein
MNIAQFLEQRGHQQGLEQGLQQGLEQGEQLAAQRIAQAMLENGLDLALVAKLTGLRRSAWPCCPLIFLLPSTSLRDGDCAGKYRFI